MPFKKAVERTPGGEPRLCELAKASSTLSDWRANGVPADVMLPIVLEGSASQVPARPMLLPPDGPRQAWEDGMHDVSYQQTWAHLHRLWVLSRKFPNGRARANWTHLSHQIKVLLENAEIVDRPSDRRARAAGKK
jgi:hypothetical protein